jgi:hypothetical protein
MMDDSPIRFFQIDIVGLEILIQRIPTVEYLITSTKK